jgi:PAS domain S-box-containing protein
MKTTINKTKEQLIFENEKLNSRLIETEETLKAIRSGDVDAILVSGENGDQVYSISSAETPYRIFVEEMNEGAITLSKKGTILYCNQRFADLVNEQIERVIGSSLKRFIPSKDKSKLDFLLAKLTNSKDDVLVISLNNTLFIKLSFHLLPNFLQGENCIIIATDISEMKKKENELLELHRSLEQQLGIVQFLRMNLIDEKSDAEVEINKLKKTNRKLVKENAKHKLIVSELKQRIKQKQIKPISGRRV